MDPKVKTLIEAIKSWWDREQYATDIGGNGGEYDRYGSPPYFVTLAEELEKEEKPG